MPERSSRATNPSKSEKNIPKLIARNINSTNQSLTTVQTVKPAWSFRLIAGADSCVCPMIPCQHIRADTLVRPYMPMTD